MAKLNFPPSLKRLLKRQARLTAQIAAHPALQQESVREAVEFLEDVLNATNQKALANFEDAKADDFVWPDTLDEVA